MRIPKNWLTFRLHYFSSIFMTRFSFMQSKQLKQNSHYVSVHDIYGCGCILFFQFYVIPLEIEKNLWNWTCLGTRLLQRHKNNNNNSIAIWWILFHLRLMLRINKKNPKKKYSPTDFRYRRVSVTSAQKKYTYARKSNVQQIRNSMNEMKLKTLEHVIRNLSFFNLNFAISFMHLTIYDAIIAPTKSKYTQQKFAFEWKMKIKNKKNGYGLNAYAISNGTNR